MDLWQLNIFCKVVELKSFSKAGETIHLSQPTISSHIKDLEVHFNCRLIDRTAREAVPTKAGELVYAYAKKLLALRDETEAAVAEFQGKIGGKLLVGGSTIPGVYILPALMGQFLKRHTDVTFSLIIGDTGAVIQQVLSGDVELGIVGAKSNEKRLSQEKLVDDNLALVVPGNHKWADKTAIDFDQLRNEPLIIRESGSGTLKTLIHCLKKAGYRLEDLNIVAEMGSTAAVIQGIAHGIGVSILSTIAVADELASGRMKALTIRGLKLTRYFYLTRLHQRTPSPAARAFIEFLNQEQLGQTGQNSKIV